MKITASTLEHLFALLISLKTTFYQILIAIMDAQRVQYPESLKSRIKCTVAHCHQTFESVKLMKRHKQLDTGNHHYCSICDLDFEEFEELHDHFMQVDSAEVDDKHIICRHCGKKFHARETRDDHVRRVCTSKL
jgi:hypothetical protein